jgi:hypothetical protein
MTEEQRDGSEATATRRGVLGLALAATGAAVVGTVAAAGPADALTGANAIVGHVDNSGDQQTTFVHNGTANNGPGLSALRTPGTTTGSTFGENAGLVAETDFTDQDGVLGFAGPGTGSSGIRGISFGGNGALGESDQGVGVRGSIRTGNSSPGSIAVVADNLSAGAGSVGVQATATTGPAGLGGSFAGSLAPLRLVPAGTPGAPKSGAHAAGELYVDSAGNLYCCTAGGTPGTWVNLTATAPPPSQAPALHPVAPTRVYDSREPKPSPGVLSSGQSRTVTVADGRAIKGGDVTVPDLVPAGATAIAYNFTVTNTVAAGFLTVNPGTETAITSSAINWSASGQILTTGSLVAVSSERQITVIAGGGGTTDFLVDVVGYYR